MLKQYRWGRHIDTNPHFITLMRQQLHGAGLDLLELHYFK
tara:strand:+ start:273 stop:392 length:120 start_codon:yes stop_codon:yes gene_type:complete